ncbi:hypothetical protein [Hyphomicrobium sp.]|uniref:hypothetical protein n=1 Tax=Hyphomicrobium sp. TaxID=82 RepID=UPI002E357381|nr:hypothetical protein [Hyphomicrobium sp.]HEX2839834.1 hypothetical protein [Hyphomicrobium sp.]
MSAEDALKVLSDIAMADSMTYWIVGALTLLVFAVMRAMLPVKALAIVFAPFIFWGGLAGTYACTHFGLVMSHDKASNVVATSTLGMLVALVVVILLTRMVKAMTRIRNPLTTGSAVPVPAPRRVRI